MVTTRRSRGAPQQGAATAPAEGPAEGAESEDEYVEQSRKRKKTRKKATSKKKANSKKKNKSKKKKTDATEDEEPGSRKRARASSTRPDTPSQEAPQPQEQQQQEQEQQQQQRQQRTAFDDGDPPPPSKRFKNRPVFGDAELQDAERDGTAHVKKWAGKLRSLQLDVDFFRLLVAAANLGAFGQLFVLSGRHSQLRRMTDLMKGAVQCGYEDVAAFQKAFQAYLGNLKHIVSLPDGVNTIVSGDFKISVALLSRALLACNIPRVYVVGHGQKIELSEFLQKFGKVIILDKFDPPTFDIARYVGDKMDELVTLRPMHDNLELKHRKGAYVMRAKGSDITCFPLLADPDGHGTGAGTVLAIPKNNRAYHTNEYGQSFYHHAILYSPLEHLLRSLKGDKLRTMPKTMATARARYLLLVEIAEEVIAILSGNNRTIQVHGSRHEFRVSLYGKTLYQAVQSILHIFCTEYAGWDLFAKANDGQVGLQAVRVKIPEYLDLLRHRFAMAKLVERKVFWGKRSSDPPNPWAFYVLAELTNTLGQHFGEQWGLGKFVSISRTEREWFTALTSGDEDEDEDGEDEDEGEGKKEDEALKAAAATNPAAKKLLQQQKVREEKALRQKVAGLLQELEKGRWGGRSVPDAKMSQEQAAAVKRSVAVLLRSVDWRRRGKKTNGWSYTQLGRNGAPGPSFECAEEAALYLLQRYKSAKEALEVAASRDEDYDEPTKWAEVNQRLEEWKL